MIWGILNEVGVIGEQRYPSYLTYSFMWKSQDLNKEMSLEEKPSKLGFYFCLIKRLLNM